MRQLSGEDFAAILKSATRNRGVHFSLHWRASAGLRLGLVVSRKLAGSAVRRNLVKRHARELFRAWSGQQAGGNGLDVVLRVTRDLRAMDRAAEFAEMRILFGVLPRPDIQPVPA